MKSEITIGTRILAGYAVALLVFGVVGAIAYRATTDLVESAEAVNHTYRVKEALYGVLTALIDAETGQRGFLLTGEERYLEPYTAGLKVLDRHMQDLRELTTDNTSQQGRIAALQPLVSKKLSTLEQAISVRRQKGDQTANEVVLAESGKEAMDAIRRSLAEMDNVERDLLNRRAQGAKDTATFAIKAIVLGGLLATAFILILGLLIRSSITGPLMEFAQFARRVGEGDLTQRTSLKGGGELRVLAEHLGQMVAGLNDVARQAGQIAERLNAATAEILASAQQQAAATAEQAAAVQQANATMAEISQSGAQVSDRARQVVSAAQATSSASQAGLQSVRDTNRTMASIREQAETVADNVIAVSEKTQAVGKIISSVNDIAEQSHLLALNAAIQATAAGEHGRGFSVVVSEMKNLAAQSKQATVQVRSILGDIQKGINTSVMLTEEAVKRAESGRQQAGIADHAIRQLTENIEESVQTFQLIVGSSSQQQIGFEQVTQSFRNIAIASQQTASSTKQSERAAAHLSELAQQLRTAIGRYRV